MDDDDLPPLPAIIKAGAHDDLPRMVNVHWFLEQESGWVGAFQRGALEAALRDYARAAIEEYQKKAKNLRLECERAWSMVDALVTQLQDERSARGAELRDWQDRYQKAIECWAQAKMFEPMSPIIVGANSQIADEKTNEMADDDLPPDTVAQLWSASVIESQIAGEPDVQAFARAIIEHWKVRQRSVTALSVLHERQKELGTKAEELRADAEHMATMLNAVTSLDCGPDAALRWWSDRGKFVTKYATLEQKQQR